MRILSISGQNIASLARPFTIDFTAAPLVSAGLFAITGETGAGKSSILDAMCLALYGDAPRLAGGAAADEVPDPSGETIKARDSRAILRRGAVQGWAEVRFTARDGQEYIARWQARRARDKVDGRLQGVSRGLVRASDGQVLASQLSAVNDMVVTLTGFSYEEFRRTVLLAQGDFDAFLRADTNDRAGLLEKVTGTGLYRDVSVRIYERHDAARQAHDALVQRRAGYQLLSEEDRAALEGERAALTESRQADAATAKALQTLLERHARHVATARQLAQAEEQEAQALSAQAQAAGDRAYLARIDSAAPLRAPWQSVLAAQTRVGSSLSAVTTTAAAANEAATETARFKVDVDRTETELAAHEAAFKAFGPLWDQAAALDSQITTAETERQAAETRAATLAQEAKERDAVLAARAGEEAAQRATLTKAVAALSALAADGALADDWPQVSTRIADHATTSQTLRDAETLAGQHTAEATRLEQALTELAARTDRDRQAEAHTAAESTRLSREIALIASAHPPARNNDLAVLDGAFAEMIRASADHTRARADLAAASADAEAARLQQAAALVQETDAAADLTRAEIQVAALLGPSGRADLAASDAAQALRLRLEPGTPCPVCGATDHPVHADTALADLAADLRADLATARQAADTARTRRSEAQRAHDRATARSAQAMMDADRANARIADAMDLWRDATRRAGAIPDCPALPDHPGADPDPIPALAATVARARQAETEAQEKLAQLRHELAGLSEQREALRILLAGHSTTREGLNAELAAAQSGLALAQRDCAAARELVARHAAALAPLLAALGEAGSLDDPSLTDRLAARIAHVSALRMARESAVAALDALAPRIAEARSRADSAATQAAEAQHTADDRLAALEALRSERASMLGGEPTARHRTRHNEARKAALAARDTAHAALAAAATEAAAAQARAGMALAEQHEAEQVLALAQADLASALQTSDLRAADLDALLSMPRPEVDALRQRLRLLDDAVTSARAALASRRQDHADAAAEGLPDEPAETLTIQLETIESRSTAHAQRLGAIDAEFHRDTATRAGLAGLEAEIATARTELDIWAAVNHAAGSRNGDRFARVAQSITLDVLVGHANRHLSDLNPRYRLRRAADLALQVEDRDMGDEPRATRSLSGGERFLVSLALALALSRMGGKGGLAATLFIDEGFGSLDANSLDLAIDALETLQSQGRQVGVISHVEALKDRIPVRIAVHKQGGGKSVIEVSGPHGHASG